MRSLKHIALGAFLTISVFCAVIYTSCSKDACKAVTCLNFGTCNGGICKCKTGIGGNNCETIYRNLYANNYKGIATYNIVGADPNTILTFNAPNDTADFTKMEVVWKNPGLPIVTLPVTITNSSPTGSNFMIVANTPVDTLLYNGSGSVNGTTASMTLTKTPIPPHIGPTVIVYFNDFNKQ